MGSPPTRSRTARSSAPPSKGVPTRFFAKVTSGISCWSWKSFATPLNSGVQVRSHVYEDDGPDPATRSSSASPESFSAPSARSPEKKTGRRRFYDEGRRGKWLDEIKPEAKDAFKDDGWNRYRIIVQGNRYRSWINGIAASDFTDDVDKSGFVGLQVHGVKKGKGPYQVRWRNVRIRVLKQGEAIAVGSE